MHRHELLYRISAEEGLEIADGSGDIDMTKMRASGIDVGLNVEPTVRSEFFPPKGPIRA